MEKATRRNSFAASMVVAAVVLLCALAGTSAAAAGDTTRVSVASDGTEANQPSYGTTAFSADGRYVVFSSRASNLVPGDTNQERNGGPALDIFVRDRDADNDGVMDETDGPEATKTERVSVDSSGSEANRSSFLGSISADGRFVAFSSDANNLVPGDTNVDPLGNPASDIFVRDLVNKTTQRVSVNTSGTEANSYSNFSSISADGRFVAFSSHANNLAAGDTLLDEDIFVRDRKAGTTELVSVGSGNWNTYGSSISADGRYVAFFSSSPTLVSGDNNSRPDVFVRDLVNKTTERIRAECATFSCSFQSTASISADGRYVAFESDASDLVPDDTDTNGRPDVFVRDRQAGTTQRVSVAGCATEANGDSLSPHISPDGRYIAFQSSAANLVSGDTNGLGDVFVRDLVNNTTQRVSVGGSGTQANGGSGSNSSISISASGVYVAFGSSATNLVEGDTKGFDDIFVHERGNSTEPPRDCGAPITSRAISPQPNAAGWNNSDVNVTLNATDTGGSGVKEISYSIDGGQLTTVQQSSVKLPLITNEGETTISYAATDNAGNASRPSRPSR
jgi:Tol biopolymer transport system component